MRCHCRASKPFQRALPALFLIMLGWGGAPSAEAADAAGGIGAFLGEGIDFKGGMLDWETDDAGHRVAILRNYAVVILPQLTISARNMVLNVEMQEIYAEGDVLFDEANGNAFYCDQLTFNYQEWKGLAKNIRVKMDRAGVEIPVQDFLDQEPSGAMTNTLSLNNAGEALGQLKRMYVQARELRAHDRQTMELIDARITADSFAKPHWYFRSPAALFRQKEKIESYHNTVNIGSVPVLYFPYLIRDLQYDWPWMRMTGGSTGDYGVFVKTQWGWQLSQREDAYFKMGKLIFDVDYYTRRGVGVGLETTYRMGDWDSLGKLKVYGVYEHAISESRDLKRAYEANGDKIYQIYQGAEDPRFRPSLYRRDFRWAVDWEHYQQLNDFWDVRAEAHLYHDRDYLREYDATRYWSGKEPENAVNLRRMDRQWELEFVAKSRLSNKWDTSSEYYPEMRLTVPGWQLFDLPLYLKNDARVGVVDRRFDEDEYFYTKDRDNGLFALDPRTGLSESRLLDRDRYGGMFRAFNELRLEAPIKLGILALKPWVGLRTAYYSDTLGEPGGDKDLWQYEREQHNPFGSDNIERMRERRGGDEIDLAVPFGAELSTRVYSIFGAHEQWRLITEPVVGYLDNPAARLDYERDLYPIDSFDEYYKQRRIGFELHNKLQRRYYENASGDAVPERDVLDLNVAFYNYLRREDRERVNAGREFSEIEAELIYRPVERLRLTASMNYDPHDESFNRAVLGMDWRLGNLFRVRATHYHYSGNNWRYAPEPETSSQTHLAVRTKLWNDSSHYSIEGAVSYEWRDGSTPVAWRTDRNGVRHGFSKYRITLFRDLDTFELALSYVRDRNAEDHGVFFTLAPKSFMGFERPPPSYTAEVETLAEGRYRDGYLGPGYRIDDPVVDADLKDVQF